MRKVIWFEYHGAEGYRMRISEFDTETLHNARVKEFLPDLKVMVLAKVDGVVENLLDEVRDEVLK